MKIGFKELALIALLVYGYMYHEQLGIKIPNIGNIVPGVVTPDASRVVVEPTNPNLKDLASKVTMILKRGPLDTGRNRSVDATKLGDFYGDFAAIAGPHLKTTADVRAANSLNGGIMFSRTGIKGQYVGLPEAIDAVIVGGLSLDPKNVTEAQVSEVFKALQWACYEGAK